MRKSRGASSIFLTKGIDEKREAFTHTHRELEAVVSKVALRGIYTEIAKGDKKS
ncbi:MAG: hypothetical protein Q7J27_13975 [Syntrophales bacterium]|nr:hypothetical protein [Syntrophales bacterium]